MVVDVNDFGIEWQKSDKVVHKADFDDLIKAYEKLEKIEQVLNCELKDVSQVVMKFQEIEKIVKE